MRVLVTAASRNGSTAELASSIARVLRLRGLDVDELRPSEVHDLAAYDAVVLGSAIYAGRWLAPAVSLVSRLGPQLLTRPVWLFSSGPIGTPPVPAKAPDLADVVARTHALDNRVFAGRLNAASLGFVARAVVRVVRAPSGDFRSWSEVARFAGQIADALIGPSTGPAGPAPATSRQSRPLTPGPR